MRFRKSAYAYFVAVLTEASSLLTVRLRVNALTRARRTEKERGHQPRSNEDYEAGARERHAYYFSTILGPLTR